jgi:pyridoxine 4-dehydrogenase
VKRTIENLAANDISLTSEDMAEVAKVLEENPVKGGRYFGEAEDDASTWG